MCIVYVGVVLYNLCYSEMIIYFMKN